MSGHNATEHYERCGACQSIDVVRRAAPRPHRHCNACGVNTYLLEPPGGVPELGAGVLSILRQVGEARGTEFRFRWDPAHGKHLLREDPLGTTEQCEAWTSDPATVERSGMLAGRFTADAPPPTPAAMLSEALEHIRRAHDLALTAGNGTLAVHTQSLSLEYEDAKREADAREAHLCKYGAAAGRCSTYSCAKGAGHEGECDPLG